MWTNVHKDVYLCDGCAQGLHENEEDSRVESHYFVEEI